MIIGIKTTDGVAKVKTKTADGVVKAVACACCGCDQYALWGPGYDTKPETIQVLNQTLTRIGSCEWQLIDCLCFDADYMNAFEYLAPECASICISTYGVDSNYGMNNWYIQLDGYQLYFSYAPSGPLQQGYVMDNRYEYTRAIQDSNGKKHGYPYGLYTRFTNNEYFEDNPLTITISPPP